MNFRSYETEMHDPVYNLASHDCRNANFSLIPPQQNNHLPFEMRLEELDLLHRCEITVSHTWHLVLPELNEMSQYLIFL